MTRITNLLTVRIGFSRHWNSQWYDQFKYTRYFLEDVKIRDYLSGIFYLLKAPTNYFIIQRLVGGITLIKTDIYIQRSFSITNYLFRSFFLNGTGILNLLYSRKKFQLFLISLQWLLYFEKRVVLDHSNSSLISNDIYLPIVNSSFLKKNIEVSNYLVNLYFMAVFTNFLYFIYLKELGYLCILCNIKLHLNSIDEFNLSNLPLGEEKVSNFYKVLLLRDYYLFHVISNFSRLLENSLFNYSNREVYFDFNFYFVKRPSILSAKMICEFVLYNLEKGDSMNKIFLSLRKWQLKSYANINRINDLYYKLKKLYGLKHMNHENSLQLLSLYSYKKHPIVGLRIELNGTSKKGKMAKKTFYSDVVREPVFSGRMPNNTMNADIDYYQSYAVRPSSTIGIRVWVFFKTPIYNNNNRYISIQI